MEDVITRYGLAAVFAGCYLEGDVTAILAGVVAHLGMIALTPTLVVVFLGGVLRDATCYLLGRASTRARKSAAFAHAAASVDRLAGRLGPLQIVVAPFVYGVRTASMIFWGASGLPFGRFLALDVAGCAAWTLIFCGAGYLLSNRAESVIGEVKSVEKWLLGAVLLIGLAIGLRFLLSRRADTMETSNENR